MNCKSESVRSRVQRVRNLLKQLSLAFGVDTPKIGFQDMELLHGFYLPFSDKIVLNSNILDRNLAEALRTVRHEFFHYLQETLCLPDKKPEWKAKRFEKGLNVGVLPRNQTKLLDYTQLRGKSNEKRSEE